SGERYEACLPNVPQARRSSQSGWEVSHGVLARAMKSEASTHRTPAKENQHLYFLTSIARLGRPAMHDPPSAAEEIGAMKFAKVVSVYKSAGMLAALLAFGLGVAPTAHAQTALTCFGVDGTDTRLYYLDGNGHVDEAAWENGWYASDITYATGATPAMRGS